SSGKMGTKIFASLDDPKAYQPTCSTQLLRRSPLWRTPRVGRRRRWWHAIRRANIPSMTLTEEQRAELLRLGPRLVETRLPATAKRPQARLQGSEHLGILRQDAERRTH